MNAEITQYGMPAPTRKIAALSKQRFKDEVSPKSYEVSAISIPDHQSDLKFYH